MAGARAHQLNPQPSVFSSSPKIVPLSFLAGLVSELQRNGKAVVQCHGVFDLLHIGHIRHFEAAKRLGDVLVVTVTPDRYVNKGPDRPVFGEALRAAAVGALGCVDYVAVNEWPMAVEAIRLLKPDIFVKGSEYRDAAADRTRGIVFEEEAVKESGGRLAFTDDVMFSSSGLLNRNFGIYPDRTAKFLDAFAARYGAAGILKWLDSVRALKVLVIGEAIIDEYQYCETMGKSGKEPVLAARHIGTERFAGGIMAVANHTAAGSDHVTMLTCLGQTDSHEDFIVDHTRPQIDKIFHYVDNAPTILKRRFIEAYPAQKLFEVYVMADPDVYATQSAALRENLDAILPSFDVVIVADYGHGMITAELADTLCSEAKFLAINTQVNAGNQGLNTVSKFRRADFISISERELRLDARRPGVGLRELVLGISEKLSCERVLITRGEQGCLAYSRAEGFSEVPAFTGRVVDRVGAGDAVLSVTSLLAARGAPMEIVGFAGSCAGAIAVGTTGNRESIERVPFARFIECLLK